MRGKRYRFSLCKEKIKSRYVFRLFICSKLSILDKVGYIYVSRTGVAFCHFRVEKICYWLKRGAFPNFYLSKILSNYLYSIFLSEVTSNNNR